MKQNYIYIIFFVNKIWIKIQINFIKNSLNKISNLKYRIIKIQKYYLKKYNNYQVQLYQIINHHKLYNNNKNNNNCKMNHLIN